MNFDEKILSDKKISNNWNKELFQLCSSIPLPITTMETVKSFV